MLKSLWKPENYPGTPYAQNMWFNSGLNSSKHLYNFLCICIFEKILKKKLSRLRKIGLRQGRVNCKNSTINCHVISELPIYLYNIYYPALGLGSLRLVTNMTWPPLYMLTLMVPTKTVKIFICVRRPFSSPILEALAYPASIWLPENWLLHLWLFYPHHVTCLI